MDIGKSFAFMFADKKWVQKLAIGGLLLLVSIIPIVNIFTLLVVIGYTVRLLSNVAEGSDAPLPEWDDWGGDWIKGLMVILAGLIYSIPIWIVSGVTAIINAVAGYGDASPFAAMCMAGLSCLSALWGILTVVVLPAGTIKYAEDGEFASFFRFAEIFDLIVDNLGNYIIALLLGFVAAIVGSFGMIICFVGAFFTGFWASLVSMHLLGQVAAQAKPSLALAAAAPATVAYGELEEVVFEPEATDAPAEEAEETPEGGEEPEAKD